VGDGREVLITHMKGKIAFRSVKSHREIWPHRSLETGKYEVRQKFFEAISQTCGKYIEFEIKTVGENYSQDIGMFP